VVIVADSTEKKYGIQMMNTAKKFISVIKNTTKARKNAKLQLLLKNK